MSHDPARVAETKSWFVKAASDLRAATHELTAVPPLTASKDKLRGPRFRLPVFHTRMASHVCQIPWG